MKAHIPAEKKMTRKHRLCRYMEALQSFYAYLDGFDDAAKYRCLQILKDAGVEWRE